MIPRVKILNKTSLEPDSLTIAANVEHICGLGCTRVNEIINALENSESLEELDGVPAEHQKLILTELKAIMAVYETTEDENGTNT